MYVFGWRLFLAALFIFGVYWCYEVIRRLRDDIQELREVKETTRRAVIIIIWAVTVVIAILLVRYSVVIIARLASLVRELL